MSRAQHVADVTVHYRSEQRERRIFSPDFFLGSTLSSFFKPGSL